MTTKSEIIAAVAVSTELPRATVTSVLNAYVDELEKTLLRDKKLEIFGFGTFALKDTAARVARNPQTGDPVNIAAGRKISFRPSKTLKGKL